MRLPLESGEAGSSVTGSTAMRQQPSIPQVGAQDPTLKNSPIAEEEDEETDVLLQEVPGATVCHFNGTEYPNGAFVRSGATLLKCRYGVWMDEGSADPQNQ
jgi:hypothetical protein